ncbi:MAG: hypothetical protein AAGI22_12830 [Planctomycetota bacterium]
MRLPGRSLVLASACAVSLSGCLGPSTVPAIGSAEVATDFASYSIRRVGFIPFRPLHDTRMAPHEVGAMETSFHAEFSSATPYDIIPLDERDLAEILPPEPFRRGWYSPEAIVTIRDRYRLDAVFIGSVTARRLTPPLVLGAQLDLVSCETGQTIWSSDIVLDASNEATRRAIHVWAERELGRGYAADVALMSPRRFAHFAAYQMARML